MTMIWESLLKDLYENNKNILASVEIFKRY